MKLCNNSIILILCLVLSLSMSGCSSKVSSHLQSDEEGRLFSISKNISIPVKTIRDLNPVTSQDADLYQISHLIYDSLVTLDDTLTPMPALSESWEYSKGNITFKIKDNIKFSDGSSLTAEDVVFSFKCYKTSNNSIYSNKLSHIKSVRINEPSSVVFEINDASLTDFNFPILSSSQFSSVSDCIKSGMKPLVGTGKYKITSVDIDKSIELTPNNNYYGKVPDNNISLEMLPIKEIEPGMVTVGDVDVCIYKNNDRENLNANEELNVTEFTSNQFEVLGFNCSNPILAKKNIRQGLSMLIDRNELINSAYYNCGKKNDDLYYPGFYGSETGIYIKENSREAIELLKSEGYILEDSEGYLCNNENKRLSLKLIVEADNPMRLNAANIIKTQLFNNGIEVSINPLSIDSFKSSLAAGSYDIFIGGWQVDEGYDLRPFYHSGYGNFVHYSNAKVDSLLDNLYSDMSVDNTLKRIKELKKILHEDIPYLCIMYKTYVSITSTNLEGIRAPRFNNYYFACDDWKIKLYDTNKAQS